MTSLLEYTPKEVRLLLIDDCSPDPRIGELFGQLKERFAPRLETCRNETNLGFVRTVNRGFELAAGCDVIILNSDTVVSHRWSTLLKLAAYRSDAIGTVSAVSNNSNAFSVPIKGENPLPPHQTLPQISRMYFQHARNWGPEIHNGHGFCMYIKRALLDDVGMFDAETFGHFIAAGRIPSPMPFWSITSTPSRSVRKKKNGSRKPGKFFTPVIRNFRN